MKKIIIIQILLMTVFFGYSQNDIGNIKTPLGVVGDNSRPYDIYLTSPFYPINDSTAGIRLDSTLSINTDGSLHSKSTAYTPPVVQLQVADLLATNPAAQSYIIAWLPSWIGNYQVSRNGAVLRQNVHYKSTGTTLTFLIKIYPGDKLYIQQKAP